MTEAYESPSEGASDHHHTMLECPACGAAIHVVACHRDGRARWVCLDCRTVGCAAIRLARPDVEGKPPASAATA